MSNSKRNNGGRSKANIDPRISWEPTDNPRIVNLTVALGDDETFCQRCELASADSREQYAVAMVEKHSVLANPRSRHLLDEALQRAARFHADELEPKQGCKVGPAERPAYTFRDGTIVWFRRKGNGETTEVVLANFSATIERIVYIDDGQTETSRLELRAELHGKSKLVSVPTHRFPSLNWVIPELGPRAILTPGSTIKDHARAAIQHLSAEPEVVRRYAHTGWTRLEDGTDVFLHAGGAIGPIGPIGPQMEEGGLTESVPDSFVLPDPPTGELLAVAADSVLQLLDVGPDRVTFPLLCAVLRAPFGDVDYGLFVVGGSGGFKTEIAARMQQFYGPPMDRKHLPGSWASTENSLEAQAFTLKDALFVVDDFAPTGTSSDVQRLHKAADRLFRGQGNCAGRGRMDSEGNLRPTKFPRGLVMATGEEIPHGHSLRARTMIVPVAKGEIDSAKLRQQEVAAGAGRNAEVMSAFLSWMARDLEGRRESFLARALQLRGEFQGLGRHNRAPDIAGQQLAAFEQFGEFLESEGLQSPEQVAALVDRCRAALLEVVRDQESILEDADPVDRFFSLVSEAVASGVAHVAGRDSRAPEADDTGVFGWRCEGSATRPQGTRIGWWDHDGTYLLPTAALRAAKQLAGDGAATLPGVKVLGKLLFDRRLLLASDRERGKYTTRISAEGGRPRVLHLSPSLLTGGGQWGHQGQSPAQRVENGDPGPNSWPHDGRDGTFGGQGKGPGPGTPQPGNREVRGTGPEGPIGPLVEGVGGSSCNESLAPDREGSAS